MATLADVDYRQIQQLVRNNDAARALFKSWGLSKATWRSLFQAAENWFVGAFSGPAPATSFKTALDAVATTTLTQARWVGKIWFMWRIEIDW